MSLKVYTDTGEDGGEIHLKLAVKTVAAAPAPVMPPAPAPLRRPSHVQNVPTPEQVNNHAPARPNAFVAAATAVSATQQLQGQQQQQSAVRRTSTGPAVYRTDHVLHRQHSLKWGPTRVFFPIQHHKSSSVSVHHLSNRW